MSENPYPWEPGNAGQAPPPEEENLSKDATVWAAAGGTREALEALVTTATPAATQAAADDFEAAVAREAFSVRVRAEARRRVTAEAAPPQPFDAALLSDVVIEPVRWRVEELLAWLGRLLIAAQRKCGKTTLTLNLARALILGCDFLDRFRVQPVAGCVGFLNFEVARGQLCLWAREVGVPADRLFTVHLRGRRNPFADADETARLADLLREHAVEVLMVDPFGRAFSGVNQNDAAEVGAFLSGLDRFATAAGVSELVLTTHAGWDGERSRGSSALEDWADAVAYLTRDKENDKLRYFRAIGRDVEVDEDRLNFDPATRRLTLTGEGSRATARASRRTDNLVEAVVEAVDREPGANSGRLQQLLKDAGLGLHRGEAGQVAGRAAEAGMIVRVSGPRGSFRHFPKNWTGDMSPLVPTSPQGTTRLVPTPPNRGGTGRGVLDTPLVPKPGDPEVEV